MKKEVIAYLHTHWDREWYRTREEFNLRLVEVFDEVLYELKNDKAPCFYFDGQTDAIESYLEIRPEKLNLIKKLIKEKKLFIGPFSISADSFLTDAWFLIKNLENGIEFSKKMGCNDFIGYLADTFGHTKAICEILKYFNIDKIILWRGSGFLPSEFIFNGIKTTRLIEGYFVDLLHKDASWQDIEIFLDKIAKYSGDKLLLPLGGDHLKILENSKHKINVLNKELKKYKIVLSNPFEYFKNLSYKKEVNGEFLNNDANFILQGVYSARIYQKIKNAKLQFELSRITEPLDIINGSKYKPHLNRAYKILITNHAHDSMYGCSTDEVHRQITARQEKVSQIVEGVKQRIIRDIKLKYQIGKGKIACVNMSDFEFEGVIRLETTEKIKNAQLISKKQGFAFEKLYDTKEVPITEDYRTLYTYLVMTPCLKPFSYSAFEAKFPDANIKITETSIENKNIKLEVAKGKINIENKKTGLILKDCLKLTDTDDLGDSYNFAPGSAFKEIPVLKTKILEKGYLRSILRISYKNIKLDAIIYNNSKYVEFKAHINNKKKNHKLQAMFALPQKITKTCAKDTLGIVQRVHDADYSLLEHLYPSKPQESKTNFYPMQSFVCTQGIGLVTVGLNEYEVFKNNISIALLRSFGIISNPKNPARSIPAGPPIEVPEAQCLGWGTVQFAFAFGEIKDMYKVSQILAGCEVAFEIKSDKNFEKELIKPKENYILCGLKNSKEAIFYDEITGKLSF